MSRAVQWSLLGSVAVAALIALAGCGHYFNGGEREAWRHDAEVACLNSGAVKDGPERVRISAISGPGICGMDFPIRVSDIGESAPLGYDDEALRPPGAVPDGALPQHWPMSVERTAAAVAGQSITLLAAAQARQCRRHRAVRLRPAPMQAAAPPTRPRRCRFMLPACRSPARTMRRSSLSRRGPMAARPAPRSGVLPPPKYPPPDPPPPTYTPRALRHRPEPRSMCRSAGRAIR